MNKEVERYINEERERGTPEDTIRHALLAKGWEYQDVEAALLDSMPVESGTLFTRAFFRFAFGFIAIIMISVALILSIGAYSNAQRGAVDTVETQK